MDEQEIKRVAPEVFAGPPPSFLENANGPRRLALAAAHGAIAVYVGQHVAADLIDGKLQSMPLFSRETASVLLVIPFVGASMAYFSLVFKRGGGAYELLSAVMLLLLVIGAVALLWS